MPSVDIQNTFHPAITMDINNIRRQNSRPDAKHPLTLYHTIPYFDSLKIYSCGKHCEKMRNCF